MCCSVKVCMCCTCVILVVVAIGLVFGFGVYKHGFSKIKHAINHHDVYDGHFVAGRPFLGYTPPPPFY